MISAYYQDISKKDNKNDYYFSECVDTYIEWLYKRVKLKQIDINTLYDHVRKIEADILPFFKTYKINEITTEKAEEFIEHLRTRGNKNDPDKMISETTVSNILKTLKAIFNFLKNDKRKIVTENPVDNVENKPIPRITKKELPYFKVSEALYALECLNKFANIRLKTFMNMIFALGCRCEECCGLRWKDIDFENKEIKYNFAVTNNIPKRFAGEERVRVKDLKTKNSYRVNLMPDDLAILLKKYYDFKIACGFEIKEEDFIFTKWDENKVVDPYAISGEWRDFKKEYHIKDVDLHRIRHSVASILEKRGIPKKDIAKFLGNTELVLQEYYTHVDYDDLNKINNTMEDTLFSNLTFVSLNIDFVSKILNEYPFDSYSTEELKDLDLICAEEVNDNNYYSLIRTLKDIILTEHGEYNFFIDSNEEQLKVKIETFKKFNNGVVKLKKINDFSVRKDVLLF